MVQGGSCAESQSASVVGQVRVCVILCSTLADPEIST